MEDLVKATEAKCSVSSVLNRDHKMYGKKHLFDGTEETCWNSEQGKPQWILIRFGQSVSIKEVNIMFQGGFVGQDCSFRSLDDKKNVIESFPFYPTDINYLQKFSLDATMDTLCIQFNDSTDFFGRVTIYQLQILGEIA